MSLDGFEDCQTVSGSPGALRHTEGPESVRLLQASKQASKQISKAGRCAQAAPWSEVLDEGWAKMSEEDRV